MLRVQFRFTLTPFVPNFCKFFKHFKKAIVNVDSLSYKILAKSIHSQICNLPTVEVEEKLKNRSLSLEIKTTRFTVCSRTRISVLY